LQDRLFEIQLGHELLEPSVLFLELRDFPNSIGLQPRILPLSALKRRLGNLDLAGKVGHGMPHSARFSMLN
jgi:hypothetical protein